MRNFVYRYGLRNPTSGLFHIDRQLKLAFEYHKKLVEIEVSRRAQVAEIVAEAGLAPYTAACQTALAEVVAAEEDLKGARANTRSRSDTPAQRERVVAAKQALKAAREAEKKARNALFRDPAVKEQLAPVDVVHATWAKAARAACGVFWGTYLQIEQAMEQAKKGPELHFPHWTGGGLLAVQIQHGLSAAEIFASNTRCYLDPVPAAAWDRRRSPEQRTTLHLRVASDSSRKPIWGTWPVILHRPLPAGSRIKWAVVTVRRLAGRPEWSLCLSLEAPEIIAAPGNKLLAVDLGWRNKPSSLRGGFYVGSDGRCGEIGVDDAIRDRLTKVEDLQSIRKKNLNALQAALLAWMTGRTLPAWMAELGVNFLALWKATGRFVTLARAWREARFDDDDEGFALLDAWEIQDYHLWKWEANLRDKVLRRRREVYRVFSAQQATQYDGLVLEDFDLSKMQRHIPCEKKEVEIPATRQQQRIAAPSELRLCLINAFTMRGKWVVKLDPAYTTQECHLCGHTEKWDAAAAILHTCPGCGATWDQDENACRVLLARYREGEREGGASGKKIGNDSVSGDLPVKESRWARLKRTRSQKQSEVAIAGETS